MSNSFRIGTLRIGVVAGEMSGDSLGAGFIREFKSRYPDAVFEGIGGPKMIQAGCVSLADQERLAVMGYVEPLKRLPELLAIRKKIRNHFIDNPPDVFIGIDSPGFNLGVEKYLRERGIKTVHYVSPQIWAWRQGRVKKIARCVDLMLTLFPFEEKFYSDYQVPVTCVGHTLADSLPLGADTLQEDKLAARKRLGLPEAPPLIALLPGSRGSEVKLLIDDFLGAARLCVAQIPEVQFVIPAANQDRYDYLQARLKDYGDLPVTLLLGNSHDVMGAADVVLMASGTTTLEAMLLKRPMVVAYRFPPLSWAILSRLLKIPYVSLPNILAGKRLVPELLQTQVTAQSLATEIVDYFAHPEKVHALQMEFLSIHQSIKLGANQRAVDAVLGLIGLQLHPGVKDNV